MYRFIKNHFQLWKKKFYVKKFWYFMPNFHDIFYKNLFRKVWLGLTFFQKKTFMKIFYLFIFYRKKNSFDKKLYKLLFTSKWLFTRNKNYRTPPPTPTLSQKTFQILLIKNLFQNFHFRTPSSSSHSNQNVLTLYVQCILHKDVKNKIKY